MYKPYISMKNLLKAFLLFIALFLLTMIANARKFYFSTSGSDSYTTTQAQNSATPWQSLKKVQDLSRSLTFAAGEISTASKVFVDTIANHPESWNYRLLAGSPAIGAGIGVGISTDYGGAPVTNPPSIGIYNAP